MKVFFLILFLVGSAAAYDPMKTNHPENATGQVVDSMIIGLQNTSPHLIAITILGFLAVTFAAAGIIFYVMNKSQGGVR